MSAIKNKIRSRKGASITFALLIFLVCAIISVVVIVAATASAGRMSQVAETDQRYYAVTSAAGLLRDEIDGMRVTVCHEAGKVADTIKEIKIEDVSDPTNPKVINSVNWGNHKLAVDATKLLTQALSEHATKQSSGLNLSVTPESGSGGAGEGDIDFTKLDCVINEYATQEGRLILEISNKPAETESKKIIYTLQAIFNANISQSSAETKSTNDAGEMASKTIVTTAVEWKFSSVKKGAVVTGG